MKHRLPWQQAQEDFSVAWWSAKDILKMEPRLTPGVGGGIAIRQVGLLDSYKYCLALLEAATRRGATVRTGQVRGLRYQGGRGSGGTARPREAGVPGGGVGHGAVDRRFWGMDGYAIACNPPERADPATPCRRPSPALHLLVPTATLLVSRTAWCGWAQPKRMPGLMRHPLRRPGRGSWRTLMVLLPCLEETELVLHTACLRPVTGDGLPILGQVPQKQGVVIATGGGRKGILLSPIMGRVAAELVTTGTTGVRYLRPDAGATDQCRTGGGQPAGPPPVLGINARHIRLHNVATIIDARSGRQVWYSTH